VEPGQPETHEPPATLASVVMLVSGSLTGHGSQPTDPLPDPFHRPAKGGHAKRGGQLRWALHDPTRILAAGFGSRSSVQKWVEVFLQNL